MKLEGYGSVSSQQYETLHKALTHPMSSGGSEAKDGLSLNTDMSAEYVDCRC